jgi:hypothetical protein
MIRYDNYIKLVRACNTVAIFMYGNKVYENVGPAGVISLFDHIWRPEKKILDKRQ